MSDQERRERDMEVIREAFDSSHGYLGLVSALADLLAAARAEAIVSFGERIDKAVIWKTWLVEDSGQHDCGTEPGGHFGAHEPGCGLEPLLDLSTLSGYASLIAEAIAPYVEREKRVEAVVAAMVESAGPVAAYWAGRINAALSSQEK